MLSYDSMWRTYHKMHAQKKMVVPTLLPGKILHSSWWIIILTIAMSNKFEIGCSLVFLTKKSHLIEINYENFRSIYRIFFFQIPMTGERESFWLWFTKTNINVTGPTKHVPEPVVGIQNCLPESSGLKHFFNLPFYRPLKHVSSFSLKIAWCVHFLSHYCT